MPGLNRMGPMGNGPMTGRGLGLCRSTNPTGFKYGRGFGRGMGLGCGRGVGRGFAVNYTSAPISEEEQKANLISQKEFLESELENISKQIEEI